jgi:hypothetical protein
MDEDDIRDYEDQTFVPPSSDDIVPPRSTAQLGPYSRFLADMPDWIDMSQGEYTKAFDALPMPRVGPAPPGISLQQAIQASNSVF